MGLRTHLQLTPRTRRRAATLARPLQHAATTQLTRRPTPDQPHSQPPWAGHLARSAEARDPCQGGGHLHGALTIADRESSIRSSLVRPATDIDRLTRAAHIAERLCANVETVVHGKTDEIKLVLAALACEGHVLFEDVPGTAKTVLARALAGSISGMEFQRVQCTPDLQPTDVTGLSVYNQKERDFE